MNQLSFAGKKGWIAFITTGIIILASVIWSIANTYQNITVDYDDTYATIYISNETTPARKISPNTAIKVQNGDYLLSAQSGTIQPFQKNITVSNDSTHFTIDPFSFTKEKLQSLYKSEQSKIMNMLTRQYPKIKTDYTIKNDKLYAYGQYFGATLVYNNQKSQNRDTLHVLLVKQGDSWQVATKPPTPIISSLDFPNVPKSVLSEINQGR